MKRICFKTSFIFILIFACIVRTFGVPAYPYKVYVKGFDGRDVAIYMQGDERKKFAKSEDGYTLLNFADGWWYAEMSDNGYAQKSAFKLVSHENESKELKEFKRTCPKDLNVASSESSLVRKVADSSYNTSGRSVVGERHALVILMQFSDVRFKKSKENFEKVFNQVDYSDGSVRDFYRFASQGQLDYISDIYGPYTAKYDMKYYGGNDFNGNDSNPLDLCIEAMKSLPADIDLSIYDNDGDGYIDNVHIIYAGYGEEAGASANAIWAHEYPHRINLKAEIGYSLAGYSCSPELRNNQGSNITNIGVICHELGHALGAMDYYDTNYGTGGEYSGTGKWDIMASGSWNDNGKTPANFNPYVRSEVFGWNKQVVLQPNQDVIMPLMTNGNADQTIVYRMETGSNSDYFLLENRARVSFDSALPGEGLMIYHVHPNIEKYKATNSINASHPQCFYPVCASGSEPNKKKYGNINSAECPFPGTARNIQFSAETMPAALAWNGASASVALNNIVFNQQTKTVSFTTNTESVIDPENPDSSYTENNVYKESFEYGLKNRFSVSSLSGSEVWRTYKKGNLVVNPSSIPDAVDGESLLMLYCSKGTTYHESEITSMDIAVNSGAEYVLSFDIYSDPLTSLFEPTFDMYIEDEYGEHKLYSLSSSTMEWTHVELPVVFAGEKIRYTLNSVIRTGGIFIDNICLSEKVQTTGLQMTNARELIDDCSDLYTIDGKKVSLVNKYLKSGIYILRSNGIAKKILIK